MIVTAANLEMMERRASLSKPTGFVPLQDDTRSVDSNAPLPFWPVRDNKRDQIFAAFDDPNSSLFGKGFSLLIITLIFYSTVIFIIETVRSIKTSTPDSFWLFSEVFCVAWFSLEYFVRLVCVRGKFKFVIAPMNVIDVLAIAPFYIDHFFQLGGSSTFLRVLRLLRVFRVFKMGRYSSGMQLMATTMAKSVHTLALLSVYLGIALVVFSSMIYFAECGEPVEIDGAVLYVRPGESAPSPYSSIPASFWWCIVTMTTVGYGDVYPTTPIGKLVASLAMLCGVLVLALPINVIGGNFVDAYVVSQKKDEVTGIPTFNTHRDRADFYEQKCAELVAVVSDLKSSVDTAENIIAELEKFKEVQVQKSLDEKKQKLET